MQKIITIQHTQSEQHVNRMIGCWTDWNLTEYGRNHADKIGRTLKNEIGGQQFVMYSSDLKRAEQTADIVGGYLNLTPVLRRELRELHVGISTPTTREDYNKMITPRKSMSFAPNYKPLPNAESERELWLRMHHFLNEMLTSPDENIIIVSHTGALQAFYAAWICDDFEMYAKSVIRGKPGSVAELKVDPFGRREVMFMP